MTKPTELCTQWVAKDPRFLHADNEDSDQTGRMLGAQIIFSSPEPKAHKVSL